MRDLRVLVVDDSAVNRRALSDLICQVPGVTLAGVAGDGDEALRLAASLMPDLITLDLEMPRMDGFTFLRLLMASRPVPVVVVSSHSAKDNVFRALELGAIDFVAKPDALLTGSLGSVREQLVRMVEIVRRLSPMRSPERRMAAEAPTNASSASALRPLGARAATGEQKKNPPRAPTRLIVVASSTGGPTALLELFSRLRTPSNACVVVAQHMPERFTKAFAERLDRASAFRVREAEGGERLAADEALVCPGGKSLEVDLHDGELVARVCEASAADRYAPSADRLFRSASRAMGARAVGVVLTGMGDDGAEGVVAIKDGGGRVLVESEKTAVIYGMPRAAAQTGAVDASLPLSDLVSKLLSIADEEPGGSR